MSRDFPHVRDNTPAEPFLLNIIYDELRRWRKFAVSPPLVLRDAQSAHLPPRLEFVGSASSRIFRATVTTDIPSGSIVSPSTSGRVTLYTWDGSTSSAGETGVTVLNDFALASSVPVGATIKVAEIDGAYWLVSTECW